MNKTILLADDDASVRHMLGRALNEEEYDVVPAKTGREAASLFLTHPPDLVLLDLNMPEKDGWDVFHLMKELNPWLPIIIITGAPNQYTRALRLGASALMEKPLDLPALFPAIKSLIEESEHLRQADEIATLYEELPPHQHACEMLPPNPLPSALIEYHFKKQPTQPTHNPKQP